MGPLNGFGPELTKFDGPPPVCSAPESGLRGGVGGAKACRRLVRDMTSLSCGTAAASTAGRARSPKTEI